MYMSKSNIGPKGTNGPIGHSGVKSIPIDFPAFTTPGYFKSVIRMSKMNKIFKINREFRMKPIGG